MGADADRVHHCRALHGRWPVCLIARRDLRLGQRLSDHDARNDPAADCFTLPRRLTEPSAAWEYLRPWLQARLAVVRLLASHTLSAGRSGRSDRRAAAARAQVRREQYVLRREREAMSRGPGCWQR